MHTYFMALTISIYESSILYENASRLHERGSNGALG